MNESNVRKGVYRIAIIGCGPRGLQCLETLDRNVSREDLKRCQITVFESAEHPGAGRVYDPNQPHCLRMNYASEHIDFWQSPGQQTTAVSGSLIGWLKDRYPDYATSDQYVPRAVVGEYLSDCYRQVTESLQKKTSLSVRRETVGGVHRSSPTGVSNRWIVQTGNDQQPADQQEFDCVVVTTGHQDLRASDRLSHQSSTEFVHPVATALSEDAVPPGCTVHIRGFALTAIDAILSLTEGRGGQYIANPSDRCEPMIYQPAGGEPSKIYVESRTGRPGLCKPTNVVEPVSDRFWDPYRRRLFAIAEQAESRREANTQVCQDRDELRFHPDLWAIICQSAADLLYQSGQDISASDVKNWFRGWSRYRMDSQTAIEYLRQSLRVAHGHRQKDIPYALGEAWRKLYGELVSIVSYGRLSKRQHDLFTETAVEMERIAFGPPARSVERVLAAVDRGIVVTCNGDEREALGDDAFDVHRDAVISSPRELREPGVLKSLVDDALVRIDPISGGLMIDANGQAIDAPPDLYIFGRATEGWIVGNDTLSRTLHDHIERWSRHLPRRIRSVEGVTIDGT